MSQLLANLLITAHLLITGTMILVILMQRSEGGVLGSGGSVGNFMTGRGQANALTRVTAILGTLFFLTSLSLALLANYRPIPTLKDIPVKDNQVNGPKSAPAVNSSTPLDNKTSPATTPLDALKQLEQAVPKSSDSSVPAEKPKALSPQTPQNSLPPVENPQ